MVDKKIEEKLKNSLIGIYKLRDIKAIMPLVNGESSLLFLLFLSEDHIFSPGEIAQNLKVTKGRVTVMLSSLFDKKLVDLSIYVKDRRKIQVRLTENGRKKIASQVENISIIVDSMINKLGETRAKELTSLLDYMIKEFSSN